MRFLNLFFKKYYKFLNRKEKKHYKFFMKKYCKIERCYKCKTSKAILKEIMFYGQVTWICQECHNLKISYRLKGAWLGNSKTSTLIH